MNCEEGLIKWQACSEWAHEKYAEIDEDEVLIYLICKSY